ncbi:MAG TPA: alpha/beta fold hydrolase [Methylococcaceae bacterium]|nr:alpha/beta fold hydrolase [Methylococcaceae bacterium]
MGSVKLAYEEYGDHSSEPLLLLHGFFASSRNWRLIAKKLAEFYHVYVLDLRNHGLSPHVPTMDYPAMADDLAGFMDAHGLQSASVLGHSMGGKVAMWLALMQPGRINQLIVADISPVSYQHSFDNTIQALKQLPLHDISNRKQADDFLALHIAELDYRQFLLQNLQLKEGAYSWRIDLDVFYQSADAIVAFPKPRLLSPYEDKVLFIMGEDSTYTNTSAIYKHFPEADIVILKDTAHWLHVQSPDAFCASVIEFMY